MANPASSDLAERVGDREAQQAAGTAVERKTKTIFDLIRDNQAGYARALPSMITPERFVRVAITAIRTKPQLARCNQQSLLGALMLSAQLGLEPGGPLGHAYLVPFGNEVTFIVGYKGMIDLARRSGAVASIYAEPVFEGDEFHWSLGLHRDIQHSPTAVQRDDPTKITHVYAVARFKGEGEEPSFVVLTRAQVEKFRARSKTPKKGPWVDDWQAMALKTAVRRLATWLPMSVELARGMAADEQVITKLDVDVDDFIDVEGDEVQAERSDAVAEPEKTEPGSREEGPQAAGSDSSTPGDSDSATHDEQFDCEICEGTGLTSDENGETECAPCKGTGKAQPISKPAQPKGAKK